MEKNQAASITPMCVKITLGPLQVPLVIYHLHTCISEDKTRLHGIWTYHSFLSKSLFYLKKGGKALRIYFTKRSTSTLACG